MNKTARQISDIVLEKLAFGRPELMGAAALTGLVGLGGAGMYAAHKGQMASGGYDPKKRQQRLQAQQAQAQQQPQPQPGMVR